MVGSYFTVQLTGPTLQSSDSITIRGPNDNCGEAGTENMDPEFIMSEEGRTLNSLGTVEAFSESENKITGETELIWVSWAMRVKESVEGRLKICYCTSTESACGSAGSVSVLAGYLETRGPSKGNVELVGEFLHAGMLCSTLFWMYLC